MNERQWSRFLSFMVVASLATAARGQLIISEVVDATLPGGLPKFVELTNTGCDDIDLSAYSFGNFSNGGTSLGGGAASVLTGILSPGASYVVAYEAAPDPGLNSFFFDTYGFEADFFMGGAFVNGDDTLALYLGAATGDGSDATLVDLYGEIGVDGTGMAWEYTDSYAYRNANILAANATFDAAEWTIAGANALEVGGDDTQKLPLILDVTDPGVHTFDAPNCGGGSLVINEIMQNPSAAGDAEGEWFELYNPTGSDIDINGWTIQDNDTDSHLVDALNGSTVVPAGGYLVLGVNADTLINGGVVVDYVYSGIALANGADELVLLDGGLGEIDRVEYDNGVTFPDPNGASMSLADPAADNNVGSNWCEAITPYGDGDLGTPGAANICPAGGACCQGGNCTDGLLPNECEGVGIYQGEGSLCANVTCPAPSNAIVRITEYQHGGSDGEFIEFTNLDAVGVDMTGWSFDDDSGVPGTIDLSAFGVVAPGESVILTESDAAAFDAAWTLGGTVAIIGNLDANLGGGGDTINLYDASATLVDTLTYAADSADGITRWPCEDVVGLDIFDGWISSEVGDVQGSTTSALGDIGSPGNFVLSACPSPALVINEIMQNPNAVGDSSGEWFELYNPTASDVDIEGWTIGDDGADGHVIVGSTIVPAGGYLVLGNNADTVTNGGVVVGYEYTGFNLANSDDEVVLYDGALVEVDRVNYDGGTLWPDPTGASMSLRDPALDNNDGANWCVAITPYGDGDLGTPGAANVCPTGGACCQGGNCTDGLLPSECEGPNGGIFQGEGSTCLDVTCPAPSNAIMRITEFQHGGSDGEFIEFTNLDVVAVDMTGWSFDDDSDTPGTVDLSAFGVVAPGESVILTEADAVTFDAAWGLGGTVAIIGNLTANLSGGGDRINLYDASATLVDTLIYDADSANGITRWPCEQVIGLDQFAGWISSALGDVQGSTTSALGDLGNPGTFVLDPCRGACCDAAGGVCTDNVAQDECAFDFTLNTLCADLDPACAGEPGACCFAGFCVDGLDINACTNGGGAFQGEGSTCAGGGGNATVAKDGTITTAVEAGSANVGSGDYYGSGNDDAFGEYGVTTFNFTTGDFGGTVSAVTAAELTLTVNDRGFSDGDAVEFFFTTDGDPSILLFNDVFVNGIDNSQFTYVPVSLGVYPITEMAGRPGGEIDTFVLDLSGVAADIANAINSGSDFQILIGATDSTHDITYSGVGNTFDPGDPNLSITATVEGGNPIDCGATPDVVINEIRIDQTGGDDDEYFELYGTPGASLDGLSYVVIGDSTDNISGSVEAIIPLTGFSLNGSGFFTAAEATFTLGAADLTTDLDFENSDNVTHLLVAGNAAELDQDLDVDRDCVLDVTPWAGELDRIALVEEENIPVGTECHYGPPQIGPDGSFVPGQVYRCPDGSAGEWNIGTFDPLGETDTPGAPNSCIVPTGACCNGDACTEATQGDCENGGGSYLGDDTVCEGDADGDGVDGQCGDGCPDDPNKTEPGICGCGEDDNDTDEDGVADCNDGCPFDPEKTEPGICGCGFADIDSDNDGALDCEELCDLDPNKTEPGICGCGTPDTDSDGDSVADCNDQCPGEDDTIDADMNGTPDCAEPQGVPTVSTWGLVVLALLLLIGAKLGMTSRRSIA